MLLKSWQSLEDRIWMKVYSLIKKALMPTTPTPEPCQRDSQYSCGALKMKKSLIYKRILLIARIVLPLVTIYFALTSINMAALYGDQTRFLTITEMQKTDIENLKFWLDFQVIGFWTCILLSVISTIGYLNIKKRHHNNL